MVRDIATRGKNIGDFESDFDIEYSPRMCFCLGRSLVNGKMWKIYFEEILKVFLTVSTYNIQERFKKDSRKLTLNDHCKYRQLQLNTVIQRLA